MQTIKQFVARYRLFLLGLLTALVCAAILGWAGYDLASRVDEVPVYTIVNDEYSRMVEIPAEGGLYQTLPVGEGQTLYGVRLNLATYDHAFGGGRLCAALLDGTGNPVAQGQIDCITIKDNTFAALIFDAPYTAAEAGTLELHLWYEDLLPQDAGHPLGLWASEGVVQPAAETGLTGAMPLTDGTGGDLNGTAAVQYVTDYSGRWSRILSALVGLLLLGAVLLGFVLLFACRCRRGAVAAVLVGGLLLGGAFSLVTPPLVGPDEYTHLSNSYRAASTLLGQPATRETEEGLRLMVRACDAPYFGDATGDIGIFAYKTYLSGLGRTGCGAAADTLSEVTVDPGAKVDWLLYTGQTMGVALARILGLGFHGMLLCGRLGNLLVYLALAALALWCAPAAATGLFGCVMLLPMTLQLAASFSADGTVLGLVFCYTALCFRLRAQKARRRELLLLVLLAFAIGPAKAIYLPVVLLVLMIPARHLDPRRAANPQPLELGAGKRVLRVQPGTLLKGAALLLAAAGWMQLNFGVFLYATRDVDNVGLTRAVVAVATAVLLLLLVYYKVRRNRLARKIFWGCVAAVLCVAVPVAFYRITHMWGGLTPEQLVDSIQPNGDSIYTYSAGYVCRNLPATLKLLLRSVSAEGAAWLQGLLGTALGEPIVYPISVSWLLGVGLAAVLGLAALPVAGRPLCPQGVRARLGSAFVLLCVVGLTFFAALNWTPINYTTIFGVQGRYWLPVLPLALALLGNSRAVAARKDLSRGVLFAMLCLTSFVILQGAGLYAAWQMQ